MLNNSIYILGKSIYECLDVGHNEHCDFFLQEDCDYTGDEMDLGIEAIADPNSLRNFAPHLRIMVANIGFAPRNPSFDNSKNFARYLILVIAPLNLNHDI